MVRINNYLQIFLEGIIIFYELYLQGLPDENGVRKPVSRRILHSAGQYDPRPTEGNALTPPATRHMVGNLVPFTVYEFQVLCENVVGKAASPWSQGRTLEAGERTTVPYR